MPGRRSLIAVGPILAAALALAGGGSAGAQSETIGICQPPTGDSVTYNFSSNQPEFGYLFQVPPRVSSIHVIAQGGHGGEYSSTGLGGAGGLVDVHVPVTAGECLAVMVGGYGYHGGGDGFAKGGDHGTIPGGATNPGSSAAGGGGASAVIRNGQPLLIAGGGGGGGGDGQSGGEDGGGVGGDGGYPPRNGGGGADAKDRSQGGKGGRGGGQRSGKGGGGSSDSGTSNYHGAGGGGGGGLRGGSGGGLESGNLFPATGGGGGGGGGSSAVLFPVALNSGQIFFQSTRTCEYKHFSSGCHGQVSISWKQDLAPIDPLILPLVPAIRVLPTNLTKPVIPLSLSPVAPQPPAQPGAAPTPTTIPVRLTVFHRHKGKFRKVSSTRVTARSEGETLVGLPLTRKVRRIMRQARVGRFRLIAVNEATGQRIADHRLRID